MAISLPNLFIKYPLRHLSPRELVGFRFKLYLDPSCYCILKRWRPGEKEAHASVLPVRATTLLLPLPVAVNTLLAVAINTLPRLLWSQRRNAGLTPPQEVLLAVAVNTLPRYRYIEIVEMHHGRQQL